MDPVLFKLNPGVYQNQTEVGDDPANQHQEAGDDQETQSHRIVPVQYRLITKQTHTVDGKDRLNQERTGKDHPDDHTDISNNRDQGITQGMPENRLVVSEAFG